jgi:hypothetical protein
MLGLLGWEPNRIGSLVLDLDADKVPGNDGDAIGTWSNAAPNGTAGDFAQPTGSKKPLVKRNIIGGRSTLLFDGVDDFMTSTFAATNGAASVYVVFKLAATGAGGQSLYQLRSATPHYHILQIMNNGSYQPYSFQFDSTSSTSAVGISATSYDLNAHISGVTYNGGGESSAAAYTTTLDGVSKTIIGTGSFSGVGSTQSAIGARASGIVPMSGHIARLLYFTAALSTQQDAAVVKYLRNRYGI